MKIISKTNIFYTTFILYGFNSQNNLWKSPQKIGKLNETAVHIITTF